MRIFSAVRSMALVAILGVVVAVAPPAEAQRRSASGVLANGLAWQAESRIVGVSSTATIATGGNPTYLATAPQYSGVVAVIINFPSGGFICTGSLMNDRRSILTAAHCVTDGPQLERPTSVSVWFPDLTRPDGVVPGDAAIAARSVTNIAVHPSYTGATLDQNDIAVLRMSTPAPASVASYGLFAPPTGGLTGRDFNVAGYGARSDVGGSVGENVNLPLGLLRQGDNRIDFRWGDSDFGGAFTAINPNTGNNFFGPGDVQFSYVSDFDNGNATNDASCRLVSAAFGVSGGPKYCNTGRGAREVGVAGGDSGGPQFINGQIASITSYGITFGTNLGDVVGGLNSSFGEFSGYVPTYIHTGWVSAQLVPEPSSVLLLGAGLGVLVAGARRKRAL